jgi:hypothetical protein
MRILIESASHQIENWSKAMPDEPSSKFEPDPFLERLLNLRATDPAQYNAFPEDLKRIAEEYEREKQSSLEENHDSSDK